jgi:hypothetical protein
MREEKCRKSPIHMGEVSERQNSWDSLSSGFYKKFYFLVEGKLLVSLYDWSI